jgi:alanine racemase
MAAPIYDPTARAWVEVDLAALVRNARRLAARARVPLLPMVKADAYGLGATAVAQALVAAELPIVAFGVATVAEARALRAAGIPHDITCFSPLRGADIAAARAARVTPTVGDLEGLAAWRDAGGGPWQLSIDTGMSRAGASAAMLAADPARLAALRDACRTDPPVGAFTHFHSADERPSTMRDQETRFRAVVQALALPAGLPLHCDNSAGILTRDGSPWSYARPGVALYGSRPCGDLPLDPVAQLRARVVDLRDVAPGDTVSYGATWTAARRSRIATVSAGYADGYRRALGNHAHALLHGTPVPVVGRVTMDMTMLDVTDVPVALGDVATLLGTDGGQALTVDAVAAMGGLSPYELLTGLAARPPRVWRGAVA